VLGVASVADLRYISSEDQPNNGTGYDIESQKAAANLWGQVGQNFGVLTQSLDDISGSTEVVYTPEDSSFYYYRFIDLDAADATGKTNVVSPRTISATATCVEYNITFGGYAGFNTDDANLQYDLEWVDEYGNPNSASVDNAATGQTTWLANSDHSYCGPRCAQVLALQSADNFTDSTPVPRLWACNNTVGQVTNTVESGYDDPERLKMPDDQAFYVAGALGWNGVVLVGADPKSNFEQNKINGDTIFSPPGYNATAEYIAALVMGFTAASISASDSLGGPRQNATGFAPSAAQVVNVKWPYAGAIVAGIPILQFIMLLGVVRFASKAIILEPSYMTAAHLLYPVIKKVGKDGCLFTVDEMAERLGEDYKLAYGVRPDPNDPGHHDTTFVRDLDIIEESEGLGYIRGRMPEGRYD
jgi:hypothetical protein